MVKFDCRIDLRIASVLEEGSQTTLALFICPNEWVNKTQNTEINEILPSTVNILSGNREGMTFSS